jgi:two-component system, OmpR family, alkaline phosphatase synthesis response regulator PhoP
MSSGESAKPKILVADDEPLVRELIEQALAADNFEVIIATDGKDALQQILANNPDVILLDIRMPKLDGVTLCKALRLYKETEHTPIIMLTAYNTREHLEQSMAAGADDFLAKPFDVTELRIRVRAMLKLKHVSNELERLQQYIESIQQQRDKANAPLADRS